MDHSMIRDAHSIVRAVLVPARHLSCFSCIRSVCLIMEDKMAKKSSGKRERMSPKGDARFVKRDAKGRIAASDDVGRSQKADRRVKAKTKVKSGFGDQGDQKRKKR